MNPIVFALRRPIDALKNVSSLASWADVQRQMLASDQFFTNGDRPNTL